MPLPTLAGFKKVGKFYTSEVPTDANSPELLGGAVAAERACAEQRAERERQPVRGRRGRSQRCQQYERSHEKTAHRVAGF
jgi:hypothetical protein